MPLLALIFIACTSLLFLQPSKGTCNIVPVPHSRWSQIQHALFGTNSCRHPLAQDPAVLQQHELHRRKGQPRIAHKEGEDLHQPRTETRQDPQHRITDKAHGDLHRPKISINQASCDEGGVTNCAAPKQQIYTEEDRYRRDNTTLHRICTEARDLHNIIAKLHRKDTKEGAQRRVHRRRAVLHRVKGKTRDLHRNYGSKLRQ